MAFVYVSGGGTDSTEKGRMAWARVKGKTENELMKLPFKQAFGFRIGFVEAAAGQKHVLSYYKYVSWLLPVIKTLLPNMINTMRQVTQAMIYAAQSGYEKNVIQVKDIRLLAERASLLRPWQIAATGLFSFIKAASKFTASGSLGPRR
jgi:hypothetical protein